MALRIVFAGFLAGATAAAALAGDLIFADGFEPPSPPGEFTIGGTVELPDGVQFSMLCCSIDNAFCLGLSNNGGDELLFADTEFEFRTSLNTGQTYSATVFQDPNTGIPNSASSCITTRELACTVNNGAGTVADQDVTDIVVSCT